MFSFNGRCTTPCAGNIRNGFNLMASLRSAMLTNRVSQNCFVFLPTTNSASLPDQFGNSERTTGDANPRRRNLFADESNSKS